MRRFVIAFSVLAAAVCAAVLPAAASTGHTTLPTPIPSMVGEHVQYTCPDMTFAGGPAGGPAVYAGKNGPEVFMALTNSQWLVKQGPVVGPDQQLWLGLDLGNNLTGWLPAKCFKVITVYNPAIIGNPHIVLQPTPTPAPTFTIGEKVRYTCGNMTFAGSPAGNELLIVKLDGTHEVFMAITNSQWVVKALPQMGSDKQLWLGIDVGQNLTGWLPAKCFAPAGLNAHPILLMANPTPTPVAFTIGESVRYKCSTSPLGDFLYDSPGGKQITEFASYAGGRLNSNSVWTVKALPTMAGRQLWLGLDFGGQFLVPHRIGWALAKCFSPA